MADLSFESDKLSVTLAPGGILRTNDEETFNTLAATINAEQFSCVAAKSAILRNTLVHRHYETLGDRVIAGRMHRDLIEYGKQRSRISEWNATFIATFAHPSIESEADFERLLWSHLTMLHEIDVTRGYAWAEDVSALPDSQEFSFSAGGEPYFIVGLHECASRASRRLPFPALAFNSHRQFNHLKKTGLYSRLQKTIRAREIAQHGSINPNLAEHGTATEARQYSGRAVDGNWQCPFSPLNFAEES